MSCMCSVCEATYHSMQRASMYTHRSLFLHVYPNHQYYVQYLEYLLRNIYSILQRALYTHTPLHPIYDIVYVVHSTPSSTCVMCTRCMPFPCGVQCTYVRCTPASVNWSIFDVLYMCLPAYCTAIQFRNNIMLRAHGC